MENEIFKDKVIKVAEALKVEPVFTNRYGEPLTDNRAFLQDNLGERLSICNGCYSGSHKPDRLVVRGEFPEGATGSVYKPAKYTEITCDENKSPEQIARDIERRLMPEYRESLKVLLERIDNEEKYITKRSALIEKIARHLALEVRDDDRRDRTRYPSVWIRYGQAVRDIVAYSDEKVRFEVEADADLAIQILTLIDQLGALYQPGKGAAKNDGN